jgi:hypothetical protein
MLCDSYWKCTLLSHGRQKLEYTKLAAMAERTALEPFPDIDLNKGSSYAISSQLVLSFQQTRHTSATKNQFATYQEDMAGRKRSHPDDGDGQSAPRKQPKLGADSVNATQPVSTADPGNVADPANAASMPMDTSRPAVLPSINTNIAAPSGSVAQVVSPTVNEAAILETIKRYETVSTQLISM